MGTVVQRFTFSETIATGDSVVLCDFLAEKTGLPKARVKDALTKGAVWLEKGRGKTRRVRRAKTTVKAGDRVTLCYDETVLAREAPVATCLGDEGHYSVWYKPSGLLSQGTRYGDHCSILRQAQLHFTPPREVFPVHRLDREVAGLMLVAHTQKAAAALSGLFQADRIRKGYTAVVVGRMGGAGRIDTPIDGKPATTEYVVREYDPESDTTAVAVTIKTGRLHQIRRHFEALGHPILGDPKYGKGNKNTTGIQLVASSLVFLCPFRKLERVYSVGDASVPA